MPGGSGKGDRLHNGVMSACCSPERRGGAEAPATGPQGPARDPVAVRRGMLAIPGGAFSMGGDDADAFPDDGEGPVRTVTLRPFFIDATCVSNAQFAAF